MKIEKEMGNIAVLSDDNKRYLALATGLNNRALAGTNFSELRKEPALLSNGESATEIHFEHMVEIKEKIYIYADYLSLTPLTDILFAHEERVISLVSRSVTLFKEAHSRGIEIEAFSSALLFLSDNNELFMLPPSIVNFLNHRDNARHQEVVSDVYLHPDLEGDEGLRFSIGVLLYRSFTGVFPFTGDQPEHIRDKMRTQKKLKAQVYNPKLTAEFSDCITELLKAKSSTELNEIPQKLNEIKNIYRELRDDELEEEQKKNSSLIENFIKGYKRKLFLLKYRTAIVISSLVFLIFLSIAIPMIQQALAPPLTAGYSQEEVLDAYFSSLNELDTKLLEDTTANHVRPNEREHMIHVFVASRVLSEREKRKVVLTPEEWLDLKEEERPGHQAFGTRNTDIIRSGENSFLISYEKWITVNENDKVTIKVFTREEEFILQKTEHSYIISEIRTLSESEENIW